MELENQVVSLELAKNLKELGVKQESEFHWIEKGDKNNILWHKELSIFKNGADGWVGFSAFTVAELGEIIMKHKYPLPYFDDDNDVMSWYFYPYRFDDPIGGVQYPEVKTEAEARAKMLIYLIENKLIKL